MEPFRYRQIGNLASIGRYRGVSLVFGFQINGLVAWLMWRGYYWLRVPDAFAKVRVLFDWLTAIVFGSDPIQLRVDYGEVSGMGPSGRRRPRRMFDPMA
jgi:NADH dehydrogenase